MVHETMIIEKYDDEYGYLIERGNNNCILARYWVIVNNEEILERGARYNSPKHFYERSKLMTNSSLINYSPLHKSQYKMMCAFITYYETTNNITAQTTQ